MHPTLKSPRRTVFGPGKHMANLIPDRLCLLEWLHAGWNLEDEWSGERHGGVETAGPEFDAEECQP